MPNTVITSSKMSAMNTIATITSNAATADTDGLAEVFDITVTVPTSRIVIIIGGTGSAADGNISFSMAAGDFFGKQIVSGIVTKNTEKMIEVDTAKVLKSDGKIALTLTPAGTDKLVTNHAAYIKVIELI